LRDYCWLAFSLALAFALHPYTGLPTLAGWAVVAVLCPPARYGGQEGGSRLGRALRWHGPFLLTLVLSVLVVADFVRQTSPLTLVTHNSGLVAAILPGSRVFAAQLIAFVASPGNALTLSVYVVLLSTMGVALWLVRPWRDNGPAERWSVVCIVVLGVVNLSKWVVRLDLAHLLQNAAPLWILFVFVLRHLWIGARAGLRQDDSDDSGRGGRLPQPRAVAAWATALVLTLWLGGVVVFGLTHTGTWVGGIGTRLFAQTVPLSHPHGVIHVEPGMARRLTRLQALIEDNTTESDSILVCASPQFLYYLSQRRPAVLLPVFNFPANYVTNPVDELIQEIRQQDTRLVVFEDNPVIPLEEYRLVNVAPGLHRMIMTDYELLDEVEGMQVRLSRNRD
jgi:hypothetical protein